MNLHSTTPSSGKNSAARSTALRSGAAAYMTDRQLQAYLLARETVRRMQRAASVIGATWQHPAGSLKAAQGDGPQCH